MKKQIAQLAEYLGTDTLVYIDRRPPDKDRIRGYVVGMGQRLLLLHEFVDNPFVLNGYTVVRLADIRSVRADRVFSNMMRMKHLKPVAPPDVPLTDWPALLAWIQARYPLVWLEREEMRPGAGNLGRIAGLKKKHCQVYAISPKGQWTGKSRFAFKDITKLEFDNGYVKAFERLNQQRKIIVEAALQPFMRLPLTHMRRFAGFQCFYFGIPHPEKNRRGEEIMCYDWGIDVLCSWRITRPEGEIVSSKDFGPGRKRRDKKAKPFYAMLRSDPPVVEALEADEQGGFKLWMSRGYFLEVTVDETDEVYDQWWITPPKKDESRKSVLFTGEDMLYIGGEESVSAFAVAQPRIEPSVHPCEDS